MNPQDTTKLPVSQLAIKMDPVPLDQIIQPWAEHQISKIGLVAAAYDARKAPPSNTQSHQLAQQENQRVERTATGWDSQMLEMMTNAGVQQHGSNNAGTTSFLKRNAIHQSHQESNQNDNAAPHLDYAPVRERVANVQNTNVRQQQPFSYTNCNPVVGVGEEQNKLPDWQNQQGQFGVNPNNGQAAMMMHHHNGPQVYSPGLFHRNGKNFHNTS